MKSENPLISVIMNCHNGEKYLKESIGSVLNQTYENIELIFFDNQSNDNSEKIVKNFQDNRIKYFKSEKLLKLYDARNVAIKYSRGDLISFLDTDDIWMPTKLQKQVIFFLKNEKFKMVYSNCFILKDKKQDIYIKETRSKENITQELLNQYKIPILTVMLKKDIFERNQFNKNYEIIGDFDFFIKFSLNNSIGFLNVPLAYYRIHDHNTSLKKIHIYIKELEKWLLINQNKDNFKKYSFQGLKILIQSLKIKKSFLDGKKIIALKEIIKKPFYIKKIKYLILFFIPTKIINTLIK